MAALRLGLCSRASPGPRVDLLRLPDHEAVLDELADVLACSPQSTSPLDALGLACNKLRAAAASAPWRDTAGNSPRRTLPALRTPPGAPHRPRASTSLTRRSVRYDARAKQSSERAQAQQHGAPSCPRKADTRALRPCRACAGRRAAREFAIDISLTSLGSSQTLRRPHCSTDAANRFCSLSDTIAPAECVLRRQIWLPAPSAARARPHC